MPGSHQRDTISGFVMSFRSTMQRMWSVKPSKCADDDMRSARPVHHRRLMPKPGISRNAISFISAGREMS